MTWSETHDRWRAIREVEEAIDRGPAGVLPWDDRLERIFGDRDGLVRALEYRWNLIVQAQLDPELPEDVLAETRRAIVRRHAGLLGVLGRYARVDGAMLENEIEEEPDVVRV